MTFALRDIPAQESGSASGVIETMMQVGFALGSPLIGLVFFNASGIGSGTTQTLPFSFSRGLLAFGCSLVVLFLLVPLLRFTTRKKDKPA